MALGQLESHFETRLRQHGIGGEKRRPARQGVSIQHNKRNSR